MDPTKINLLAEVVDVASGIAHHTIKHVRKAKNSKKLISENNLIKAQLVTKGIFSVLSAFSDTIEPSYFSTPQQDSTAQLNSNNPEVPEKDLFRRLVSLQTKLSTTTNDDIKKKLQRKIKALHVLLSLDEEDVTSEDSSI